MKFATWGAVSMEEPSSFFSHPRRAQLLAGSLLSGVCALDWLTGAFGLSWGQRPLNLLQATHGFAVVIGSFSGPILILLALFFSNFTVRGVRAADCGVTVVYEITPSILSPRVRGFRQVRWDQVKSVTVEFVDDDGSRYPVASFRFVAAQGLVPKKINLAFFDKSEEAPKWVASVIGTRAR